MEKSCAVAALAALAQETRLDIFRLLVEAGEDGLPAGQIGERLGLPSATLSFHLSQLKHAHLVTFRRASRFLIYKAAYPVMSGCSLTSPRTAARRPGRLLPGSL